MPSLFKYGASWPKPEYQAEPEKSVNRPSSLRGLEKSDFSRTLPSFRDQINFSSYSSSASIDHQYLMLRFFTQSFFFLRKKRDERIKKTWLRFCFGVGFWSLIFSYLLPYCLRINRVVFLWTQLSLSTNIVLLFLSCLDLQVLGRNVVIVFGFWEIESLGWESSNMLWNFVDHQTKCLKFISLFCIIFPSCTIVFSFFLVFYIAIPKWNPSDMTN